MLSLRKCLKDVTEFATSIKTTLSLKQNKQWTYVDETTGTLKYNASKYNELLVIVGFGGVYIPMSIPVVTLYPSAAKTHFYGTYQGEVIYVNVSKTSIVMSKQPKNYTATIYLYAR